MAAERGLRLGAVHYCRHRGRLVRHERYRQRQVLIPGSGGDFPAQAQLADVRAVHRHLWQLYRFRRRLSAAQLPFVPRSGRSQVGVPRSASRSAEPCLLRWRGGPAWRRPRYLLGVRRHDRRGDRITLVPRPSRSTRCLCRLLRLLPLAVPGLRGGQLQHLSNGAGHLPS